MLCLSTVPRPHVQTIPQLTSLPTFQIAYIEQDAYVSVAPTTNDTTVYSGAAASALLEQPRAEYGLGRISHKLKGYYNYVFDSSACQNTRTYIIDTGILTSHKEFGGRAVWGANFVTGSPVSCFSFLLRIPLFSCIGYTTMSAGDLAWTEIRNGVRVVSYCKRAFN